MLVEQKATERKRAQESRLRCQICYNGGRNGQEQEEENSPSCSEGEEGKEEALGGCYETSRYYI